MRSSAKTKRKGDPNMAQDEKGKGKGWHGDPEGHAAAGRKGGEKVSQNRQHMAEIGRKGGQVSGGNFANNPQRAREAGRKGGEASGGSYGANRERSTDLGRLSNESTGLERGERSFEGGPERTPGEHL